MAKYGKREITIFNNYCYFLNKIIIILIIYSLIYYDYFITIIDFFITCRLGRGAFSESSKFVIRQQQVGSDYNDGDDVINDESFRFVVFDSLAPPRFEIRQRDILSLLSFDHPFTISFIHFITIIYVIVFIIIICFF